MDYVFKFAQERNYKIEYNPKPKQSITLESLNEFLNSFKCYSNGEEIKPHEHQLEAVKQNGMALQFASTELKNDLKVVITAIKQENISYRFASLEIQNMLKKRP